MNRPYKSTQSRRWRFYENNKLGKKGENKMNDEIEIERKEQYRPSSKGNSNNFLADKKKIFLIGGGVLAVVVIVLFFAFSGKDKSAEILAQMEQKLSAVEQKLAALEKQQEDLASGPMKSLAERVEMLEKRPVDKPKPPPPPKAQAPSPAKRYHEVKKGETMTGIAKRYGMTSEELRKINNLPPKAALAVGQKLIVSPGGKT
jgi:LysM repeat protein